jgi:hypothetical protein
MGSQKDQFSAEENDRSQQIWQCGCHLTRQCGINIYRRLAVLSWTSTSLYQSTNSSPNSLHLYRPNKMLASIPKTLLLQAILSSSLALANPIASHHKSPTTHSLPFNFTYLFTAVLQLGNATKPITVPGGILVNEPILSGRVTGPAINATIAGGFAHPAIYGNCRCRSLISME